jgi:hypothetical protein
MSSNSSDEWCDSQEIVYSDKITRCSKCGRRLIPREDGLFLRLPPHKKKGFKIQRKKGHNKRKERRVARAW